MQQRISATLRNGAGFNIVDNYAGPDPGWTTGSTMIDQVPLAPPLTETWHILGWGISFGGQIHRPIGGANPPPSYGKLGALWAGLSTQGLQPTPVLGQPMIPLPSDLSLLAKVWDGSSDPPFPAEVAAPATPPYASFQMLPTPVDIHSGSQLAFGLWLTPSLTQNATIEIFFTTYSILYDDGT